MKVRTKKKLWALLVKSALGLLKLVFYYPFKGLWWLIKKLALKIKEKWQLRKNKKLILEEEKKHPKVTAKYVPLKEIKHKEGDFSAFENKLYLQKSSIGLILGARGSGKSALGMRLLENFAVKTNKKIYAMGFKEENLPHWIKVIQNIEEMENNALILIDEGGIEFSSRRAMSDANTLLSQLLLISRHKDLNVLFITQNSANLEINAIRQADYLLLKPSSLLQKDFERKKIKEIYENVQREFEELKETKGLTYVYSDVYQGFVTNTLPGFWSEKVSKGYAGHQ